MPEKANAHQCWPPMVTNVIINGLVVNSLQTKNLNSAVSKLTICVKIEN